MGDRNRHPGRPHHGHRRRCGGRTDGGNAHASNRSVGSGLESFEEYVAESDLRFVSATAPDQIMSAVVGVMEELQQRFLGLSLGAHQ